MKEKKKNKHRGLHISRVVFLSMVKVFIPVVVGVFIFVELFSILEKKSIQAQEAMFTVDALEAEEPVVYEENPLLQDENPEINNFFDKYYEALANGDIDTICEMQDYLSDTDRITIEKKADYIEDYKNISCYTKQGLEEGSFLVFAVSDVKFYNVEATAPTLTLFYLYTKEDGNFAVQGEMEEAVLNILPEVYADGDVTDLFNKIEVNYTEAVSTEEELNAFLAELPSLLKTEVGEALALLEASELTEIEDEEVALAAVGTDVLSADGQGAVIQVVALDTVNVRSSDSSEADKIGKVDAGQILTCLEQKINGWSKILYNGKEAYVKSTYLEALSSAVDGEVIGTVKANSNVNVRSKASADAAKLGVAKMGTVYNLIEDLGEWYHIDYEGNNGYVKSEYFTR